MASKYDPETQERVIRLFKERRNEAPEESATASFRRVNELTGIPIDTTTSGGRLVFHIFGALAEFERELIRERTHAGLAAARARGRKGGRPRKLTKRQVATARTPLKDRAHSVTAVAEMLGVSRSTLYRALEQAGGEELSE